MGMNKSRILFKVVVLDAKNVFKIYKRLIKLSASLL